LFNRRQRSLDNLLNGIVSTAVEDSSNPALLFRSEMNRDDVAAPWVVMLSVGKKMTSEQVESGLVFGRNAH
jgi:hypothetical protein